MSSKSFLAPSDPASLGFVPKRLTRLHDQMERYIKEGQYAGVGTLILRRGEIADFFATGYRDLDRMLPIERDTIYRVYSMTKIVVSVAALTLIEEGKIGLREPISIYLPEFANPQVMTGGTAEDPVMVPADSPISVQHLFTHTSGITYGESGLPVDTLYRDAALEKATTLAELVNRVARLPLARQPGTIFDYGLSTDVLGRLMEVVTGEPLDKVLQERVLGPLAMSDTQFSVAESDLERLAKVYRHADPASADSTGVRRLEWVTLPPGESQNGLWKYPSGGSGLFSTLDNFARFGQMLCNGGTLDGEQILGRKTIDLMVQNHLASLKYPYHCFRAGNGFGLGVGVRVDDDLVGTLGTKGLYGWDGLATTRLRIDPVEQLVMLCGAQHFPPDEHGMYERFQNLVYQALI